MLRKLILDCRVGEVTMHKSLIAILLRDVMKRQTHRYGINQKCFVKLLCSGMKSTNHKPSLSCLLCSSKNMKARKTSTGHG